MTENCWSEEFRLCTWDVDRNGGLTLAAAFNYFQEIAGNHAESLGVGKDVLAEAGQAWILSRMSVEVDRRPRWGERVEARTWPRGTDRLFAIRDYELADGSGAIVARGRSAWLVVDVAKLRPLRPQFLTDRIPLNEGRDALPGGAAGLEAADGLLPAGTRAAAYSDIDYNGHVNNARYVQWIQDCLPPRILEEASRFRLDINYLSEVRCGGSVELYAGPAESAAVPVEGRLPEGGKAAFRAELRAGA